MAIPIKRYVDISSKAEGTSKKSKVSSTDYPAFSFSDEVGISDSPVKNFSHCNFATDKEDSLSISMQ